MIETIGTGVSTRREGALGMPTQAVPIDRTPAGVALAMNESGVEAAFWGDVWDVVKPGLAAIAQRALS